MRAELLYESAVDELKKKLPSLRKIDYSTIDNLMQRISKRYKITGKKLHDLFVSKYGHTPDTWIKKYKEKLGEEDVTEGKKKSDTYHIVNKDGKPASLASYADKESAVKDRDAKHQGAEVRQLGPRGKVKSVAEGSESDAYGNTGEKHECGSCDGTGIVSYDELAKAAEYDDVCPECGGKGWVRDKESLKKKGVAEGRKPFRDLKSWANHAKSQGLKVSKSSKPLEWSHDATDKEGNVRGRFVTSNIPQNSRGFIHQQGVAEDWQKVNKSDKTDGMSGKAVKAYRRENPGSKLKTAVTTKPSKLKKGSKSASRRKSFCARMGGMKKHNAGAKTKRDPDSPINKALRRWNCESIEELQQLTMIAEQKIAEAKNPAMQAAIAIAKKKERMKEGEVLQFPNKQQPTKPNVSPLQKKKQVTQRTTSQNVVPIAKKPAGITWKKLPKDVLKLANDWFWADMEDGGSAAVLDPKGYGSGTRNQLQFITAQLQQRGWNIDNDDEFANVLLTNKTGQSVLLPRDDAYDFKGWAAGTNSHLRESVEQKDDVQKIKDFIKWSMITLNMQKPYPKFTLSRDTEKAQKGHYTGMHTGDRIWVYIENRNLVDIFRTIFHELVHHRQDQLGMIKHGDSYPGSPIEALADMMAGKYMKIYGKDHPEIFQ